jgi:hypothetical protein
MRIEMPKMCGNFNEDFLAVWDWSVEESSLDVDLAKMKVVAVGNGQNDVHCGTRWSVGVNFVIVQTLFLVPAVSYQPTLVLLDLPVSVELLPVDEMYSKRSVVDSVRVCAVHDGEYLHFEHASPFGHIGFVP